MEDCPVGLLLHGDELTLAMQTLADAEHTFASNGVDWGFTSFVALRDLQDPSKGLCVDDTIEVCNATLERFAHKQHQTAILCCLHGHHF